MYEKEFGNATNADKLLEQLFNELFREYETKLYAFALKMVKSDALAKDIIQEVFLKLWTIRNRIPDVQNISSFLYRMTENKVIDYLRAAASDKKNKEVLWYRMEHIQSNNPEDDLEAKEFNSIIQQAIDNLSPQRRSVYLLNKVEKLQRNKIATVMGISPHTVRNQLSKSMQQIMAYIKKYR